ncbi:MAG: acyltransferase [Oscillospiraceae bacterium]|nr:acyltransferase [Oscillospiraceae bacterium]
MENKREYALDTIRIVISVIVVFAHFQLCLGADYRVDFVSDIGTFSYSYLMELFFMLSGFFTARYVRRIRNGLSFRSFFLRRYLRLLPLMALSSVSWSALFILLGHHRPGSMWANQAPTLWGTVLTSLGFQEGWGFHNSYVNHPLWFLSVLIFCYVLFYVLVRAAKRLEISPYYLFGAMIFVGVGVRNYGIELPFLNSTMCRGYYSFFPGVLLAALLQKRKPGKLVLGLCALLVAGILALIGTGHFTPIGDMQLVMTFLFHPALIVLLHSDTAARLFKSPVIGLLGKASFSVYVWHMSGILIVAALNTRRIVSLGAHPMTSMFVFTGCMFLFGIFSYYCIEKPCARLTDRLLARLPEN